MHSHLVTVKVSVEGRTNEGVQLDSLAFDEARLERLNAQTVKRGSPVEQYWVAFQHIFQDVPNHCVLAVHNFLSRFHRFHDAALDELADNERLEQLGCHVLGQAALVQFQLRTNHDYRTARIVDTLTKQVLTEAALLAFQHVGQRLQGAVAFGAHGVHLARVVE